jgi:hemerythrin-like domain-containing protein
MARSRNGGQPVAIELLESDHRKVEALFEQYEDGKDGEEDAKRALAERICGELTVHAQVEEELFYPWLRENLEDDEMEMVEEAQVEHQSAKDLIAQIEGAGSIDESFDARVKVLSEYIKHHVKEEEEEIFEAVADRQEELDELGQQMHARKAELMEEMGLEMDAPPMAAMTGARGKARSQGAQRGR